MTIRFEPEDFRVEELPLYEPSGLGTHTFFGIKKRNFSTLDAINRLARALQVDARKFGYAGLKDKHAITTQVLSVEGIPPEQVLELELPRIEVLWAEKHGHKLRVGHLRGNRFEITLRDISAKALPAIEKQMIRFETEGVPNRFGVQRFGNECDSHLIGKALVTEDWETALSFVLADKTTQNSDLSDRIKREKEKGSLEKAVTSIPHRLRKLYLSAYQAYLFNCILEMRLPNLAKLRNGDIAVKHINGAPFLVENAAIEQARSDTFEISPTGPIFGYKMRQPSGSIYEMEINLLTSEEMKPDAFRKVAGIRLPGTRRSLRMPLELHQVISVDRGICLCFSLPAGGYATVVIDELKGYLID